MNLSDVDLAALAQWLQEDLAPGAPEGYRRGKSVIRDLVRRHLECSESTSEQIVETLEQRGYLRFHWQSGPRSVDPPLWEIDPAAEI